MSLVFNDLTTAKKGIIQILEKEIGFNDGDISLNNTKLKSFTADVNLAMDDYLALAMQSSGTWQFDDSNHTNYPIITTDLLANQREYNFTTDQTSNLILDIYKVAVKDTNGIYQEIFPVDQQSPNSNSSDTTSFIDGRNTTGTPIRYDKTANGIFLDPVPPGNVDEGLKIYVNRETSYFVYTDTTKKPGVSGLHHRYFALKPAMDYIRINGTDSAYNKIASEVLKLEKQIKYDYGYREKDVRKGMRANVENNR